MAIKRIDNDIRFTQNYGLVYSNTGYIYKRNSGIIRIVLALLD